MPIHHSEDRPKKALPQVIEPVGKRCVSVVLPDDEEWVLHFLSNAFKGLKAQKTWHRDPTGEGAAKVAARWRAAELDSTLYRDTECGDSGGLCTDYYPASPLFDFWPDDPRAPVAEPPDGYNSAVWQTGDEYELPLSGFSASDVFTQPDFSFNVLDLAWGLISVGFPRFRFSWSGAATVELHLLQVFQGGLALIVLDGNPTTADIVNTTSFNLGSISEQILQFIDAGLDGVINPVYIYEREVVTPGEHYFDVTFFPNVSPDISLTAAFTAGWGGGLRKAVVCGGSVPPVIPDCPEPETTIIERVELVKLRINPEDSCEMQQLDPDTGTWVTVLDLGACELLQQAATTNIYNQFNQYNDAVTTITDTRNTYNGSPTTYVPQTSTNGLTTLNRDALYCYALTLYVDLACELWAKQKEDEQKKALLLANIIQVLVIVFTVTNPILAAAMLTVAAAALSAGLEFISVAELGSETARKRVVCAMFERMRTAALTRTLWQSAAVPGDTDTGSAEYKILTIIQGTNSELDSYLAFLECCNEGIDLVASGLIGDDCADGCDDLSSCATFNYTWASTGATPALWIGERWNGYGGPFIGNLSRASNTNWRSAADWDEVRVTYAKEAYCIPNTVVMVWQRESANSGYAIIRVQKASGWERAVFADMNIGGSLGDQTLTWTNSAADPVLAIRFELFTRRGVIKRCQLT